MLNNNPPATWILRIALFCVISGGVSLLLGAHFISPGQAEIGMAGAGAVFLTVGISGVSIGISLLFTYVTIAAVVVGISNAIKSK